MGAWPSRSAIALSPRRRTGTTRDTERTGRSVSPQTKTSSAWSGYLRSGDLAGGAVWTGGESAQPLWKRPRAWCGIDQALRLFGSYAALVFLHMRTPKTNTQTVSRTDTIGKRTLVSVSEGPSNAWITPITAAAIPKARASQPSHFW